MTTDSYLPYGRHWIDEDDIASVVDALRSDWLTTGPKVHEFESAVAGFTGAKYGVALSSGTAALHAAMFATGIGPRDEVIVPPMTFAATANCVVFQGGTPVFADVEPGTLLIDPTNVQRKVTDKTKAIIAVDYAGQPCDYDALRAIADEHGLILVADACHALGATYKTQPAGTWADLAVFSFHPVKHITTGEGGMVVTNSAEYAERTRRFRNHGIAVDHHQRSAQGSWFYEMVDLGFNYRMTDIQCSLGISQLKKLPGWIQRRQEIASQYDATLEGLEGIGALKKRPETTHVYHLYVIQIDPKRFHADRSEVFRRMRQAGIGVNVHYIPVHLHPYYRKTFGTVPGLCPRAEEAYERLMSLPIFPAMSDEDVSRVLRELSAAHGAKG